MTESRFSLPMEITFDIKDTPESSGLMDLLRDMGFQQISVGVSLPQLTYKGTFTGTKSSLSQFVRTIKEVTDEELM